MEPMEPTEPENRKAQQDSPPKTQEIEVSRGWDEDLRMYWLMGKSDLSFPVFCWLAFITIFAAQQTFAGQRSRISCDMLKSLRRARIWISGKKTQNTTKTLKTLKLEMLDA